jgi:hypothetical protein
MKKTLKRKPNTRKKLIVGVIFALLGLYTGAMALFFNSYKLQSPLIIQSPVVKRVTPTPTPMITPTATPSPTLTPTPTPRVTIQTSVREHTYGYEKALLSSSQREIATRVEERIGKTGTQLVFRESGLNPQAVNQTSGACGLFQAYPCEKMGCSLDDVACQLDWGEAYILQRYGSPAKALQFQEANNWY